MGNNNELSIGEKVYYLDFALAGNVMIAQGNIRAIYKWPALNEYLVCRVANDDSSHGCELLSNRLYRNKQEAVNSLSKNAELLKIKYSN